MLTSHQDLSSKCQEVINTQRQYTSYLLLFDKLFHTSFNIFVSWVRDLDSTLSFLCVWFQPPVLLEVQNRGLESSGGSSTHLSGSQCYLLVGDLAGLSARTPHTWPCDVTELPEDMAAGVLADRDPGHSHPGFGTRPQKSQHHCATFYRSKQL